MRKMAFAVINALELPLRKQGITERKVWDMFMAEYGVQSRSEFSDKEWALVAAQLKAAQDDALLFDILVKRVQDHKENIQEKNSRVYGEGAVHLKYPVSEMSEADRLRAEFWANPPF